jgi:hypothetical protein
MEVLRRGGVSLFVCDETDKLIRISQTKKKSLDQRDTGGKIELAIHDAFSHGGMSHVEGPPAPP